MGPQPPSIKKDMHKHGMSQKMVMLLGLEVFVFSDEGR
jgi:hypothetical protein